jgi:bifunctional oligoribonuclease and PAP phosphatase NrnA
MPDTIDAIITILSRCKRVLVTTHVRPDGDALGSSAAMVLAMKQKGIHAEALLLSHLPRKYAFIFREHDVPHFDAEPGWPPALDLNAYDALVVVDTGTWSQLPGLEERIKGFTKPKIVIDHHLTQQDWPDVKWVVTEAAAAGEIVMEVLERWGVTIERGIAEAIFLAIITDTGWFQFSNTRPQTLRTAARLMEAGVNTDRMYQILYQSERAERVALQTRAQQSLELLLDRRLAVMRIRKQDFEETHAAVPDTENLINIPLQIATVEVSILLTEPREPKEPVRVSLRSKGQVDVAKFAEHFGGGGHARASGLKLDLPFDEAHDRVVAAMTEAMKRRTST